MKTDLEIESIKRETPFKHFSSRNSIFQSRRPFRFCFTMKIAIIILILIGLTNVQLGKAEDNNTEERKFNEKSIQPNKTDENNTQEEKPKRNSRNGKTFKKFADSLLGYPFGTRDFGGRGFQNYGTSISFSSSSSSGGGAGSHSHSSSQSFTHTGTYNYIPGWYGGGYPSYNIGSSYGVGAFGVNRPFYPGTMYPGSIYPGVIGNEIINYPPAYPSYPGGSGYPIYYPPVSQPIYPGYPGYGMFRNARSTSEEVNDKIHENI